MRSARSAITAAAQRGAGADLPQGRNGVADFIPVARIADMLLHPGTHLSLQRPDARPIPTSAWSTGPAATRSTTIRISTACAGPSRSRTVVVHELGLDRDARGTPTSCCPATMTLEREDIGGNANDPLLVADAPGRDALSARRATITRSSPVSPSGSAPARPSPRAARCASGWSISTSRRATALAERGLPAPDFDEFWASGGLILPQQPDDGGRLRRFRDDPDGAPLPTPSGKIEIFSETIAGFRRGGLSGPSDLAGAGQTCRAPRPPLQLVANQPATRLHSQLDFGGHSRRRQASRPRGRAHASRGRRGARHRRRRHRPPVQRARRLPRRRARHRRHSRPASSSCRPAPGTTPPIPRRTARSACTAIRTC